MGVFSAHAMDYAARGLCAFPVNTRTKRPCVRGWQSAGVKATRQWAEKFPDADGLGIVCGPRSGITEIDIDAVSEAHVAAAMERFGEPGVLIETASGKWKAWYRHRGEKRLIRPVPELPVDVLGDGYTIAPPSYREDRGASYRFVKGSLDDLDRLPGIRANALEAPCHYRPAAEIYQGERNNWLWRRCMAEARACDDVETLIDCAQTIASQMPDPLGAAEVERVARSAWRLQSNGRNYIGLKRPQVTQRDVIMDNLGDKPDAYYLLDLFRRWHGSKAFCISPTAMVRAGSVPWCRSRIERARDVLIERGFLEVVSLPDASRRKPGRYRLIPTMSESDNNHLTPSPRLWVAA